jgi:glycosyltransferase involved in cell wall biosynthesis
MTVPEGFAPSGEPLPIKSIPAAGSGLRQTDGLEGQIGLVGALKVPDTGLAHVLQERASTLIQTLGGAVPDRPADLVPELERLLADAGSEEVWLARAVLTAHLPDSAEVAGTRRAIHLDGVVAALDEALHEYHVFRQQEWVAVEVLTGRVVVDAHHTFTHPEIGTGIQRVARETAGRWRRWHDPVFVAWSDWFLAIYALDQACLDVALNPGSDTKNPVPGLPKTVVVPWKSTYLVPELPAENIRAEHFKAMAHYSRSRFGLIGFDCVPLTAAETTAEGMAGAFALYLSAAAEVHRVATISAAAAIEYRGWRRMLAGVGRQGPDIKAISLPVEGRPSTPESLLQARHLLGVGPLPIVLSVGSHEPRKNHLSVLQAAEYLWQEGHEFTLAFVGGNAWNSEEFAKTVEVLRLQGRPVQPIVKLSDELLWAAYRLAYCTVFPSLHEGFGLPVAESLACGTPAITSNFGSMREIAEEGGALMVDPRDDAELAQALRRLLTSPRLRSRLAKAALGRPARTWDDYAQETWAYLTQPDEQ